MASTAIRAIGCAVASDMSCFENMEEVVLSPQTMAQLPRLGGTVSQSRGRLAPIQRSLLKKPLKEQVGLFSEYTRSLDARMETMLELESRNFRAVQGKQVIHDPQGNQPTQGCG
jgi:hypothetical protein